MPYVVRAIERDDRGRYRIYCEGADEPLLVVHEDVLIRHRLLKGTEIDEDRLREIARDAGAHQAYAAALAYLGRRSRTRKELAFYLSRKGFSEPEIRMTIERLVKERYLNDEQYARDFARMRTEMHYKGRNLIHSELAAKGVSREEAEAAIRALDPESERAAAVKAAQRRWPSIRGEYRDRVRKLAQYLYRRGYPADIVREAVRTAADEGLPEEMEDW